MARHYHFNSTASTTCFNRQSALHENASLRDFRALPATRSLLPSGFLPFVLLAMLLNAGCDRTTPSLASNGSAAGPEKPASPASSALDGGEAAKPAASGTAQSSVGQPSASQFVGGNSEVPAVAPASAEIAGRPSENQLQIGSLSIEPSLPSNGAPSSGGPSEQIQQADGTAAVPGNLAERSFMQLKDPAPNVPAIMNFFGECDRAIQELSLTMQRQQLDQDQWLTIAKRLSTQKLSAARKLLELTVADPVQHKRAIAAEVESLSHLTGLGDLTAAQELQSRAAELAKSSDSELAHQGKLVLLGFRMNQLQEGQSKSPAEVMADIEQLVAKPEDRGVVELMAMQQCAGVLAQLGYKVESQQIIDRIGTAFRDSPDPQLSMSAWTVETASSPALAVFRESIRTTLEGPTDTATSPVKAAAELLAAFPSPNTLWQVASQIVPLEYRGRLNSAGELAQLVASRSQQLPSKLSQEIDAMVASHQSRVGILGKPLELEGVIGFDGRQLDWSSYRGKVVIVDFWASWCRNCSQEFRGIRDLHRDYSSQGLAVLGVNMDDELASAEQAMLQQNFPWQNVRSSDPSALAFSSPLARRLGVAALPFILIVDRDGRVSAMHQRGQDLRKTVEQLLKSTATN